MSTKNEAKWCAQTDLHESQVVCTEKCVVYSSHTSID